jgi:hypothetical protein
MLIGRKKFSCRSLQYTKKKLSTIPVLVISKQILNEQSTMCIKYRHSDEDADMNRSNTLFQSICSLNEKYKIIEI